uniref:Laminin G domain-containing protein n=1 Tax=Otus sunia TaxID=257818 RepID=A0A8C8BNL8_9STRI
MTPKVEPTLATVMEQFVDLQYSRISLNFTTNQTEGLMVWMGKGEDEDNDFLAIGLANGTLKVVVNLGERICVPLIHSKHSTCCDQRWHFVTVVQNQTCIKRSPLFDYMKTFCFNHSQQVAVCPQLPTKSKNCFALAVPFWLICP